jgi:hypothetical protein
MPPSPARTGEVLFRRDDAVRNEAWVGVSHMVGRDMSEGHSLRLDVKPAGRAFHAPSKTLLGCAAARRMGVMTIQTFRNLLAARPFQPFRLVMSSGQTYDVRHPEMAWMTRTDILVGIDETRDGVPENFKICSLLHVTAIEPIGPSSAGSTQAGTASP